MDILQTAIILIAIAGTIIVITLVLMACLRRKKMKEIKYQIENNNTSHGSNISPPHHHHHDFDEEVGVSIYGNNRMPTWEPTSNTHVSNNNFMPCTGGGDQRRIRMTSLGGAADSGDSDEAAEENRYVTMTSSMPLFPRLKKSHSLGCYATSSCKGDTPYMRCPEDMNENGIQYNYNDAILHEGSLCNSYTKLKVVYDIQSETLRRTNSSPPIRTTRSKNNAPPSQPADNLEPLDDALHPIEQECKAIEGYDRAKFLYDRICRNMPTLDMSDQDQPSSPV